MKTIPEPIQNCNHRLQNCNDPRNLNPSNSTDLENRQGSTAYPDAKTMDSETLFNCFRSAESILHTACAELTGSSIRVLFANRSRNGKYGQFKHWRSKMNNMLIAIHKKQNPQPLVGENQLALLPDRNAMLTRLSWAKDLPTTIRKQSNLEPLVQEINVTKNPMIESTQPPESSHNPLHSPEAIAERLRLRAGSASGTTDDDQPEVV